MLNILICEDNPITLDLLSQKIKEYCPKEFSLFPFHDSSSLLTAIQSGSCKPDIALMDIELDSRNGIETAKEINQTYPGCQIIYITNYIDYVSDVYETSHIYYVLKHEMDLHLPKALSISLEKLERQSVPFLLIRSGKKQIKIFEKDILYLERILRKTYIHTLSDVFITSESLTELSGRLSPWFLPCHRSYLVNLHHAINLTRDDLTLSNDSHLPVGRTHYDSLKKGFGDHSFFF